MVNFVYYQFHLFVYMKIFKTASVLAAVIIFGSLANISANEKVIGVKTGYNTRTESLLAGLFFQYRFSEHFRVSPNIDYFFRHNNTDALSLNCNAHFPVNLSESRKFSFYPLAGINYTSWNYHHDNDNDVRNDNDVSQRRNRFGLNAGAGFEIYATPALKLSAEAKATFIKSYSSGTFSISIGYIF